MVQDADPDPLAVIAEMDAEKHEAADMFCVLRHSKPEKETGSCVCFYVPDGCGLVSVVQGGAENGCHKFFRCSAVSWLPGPAYFMTEAHIHGRGGLDLFGKDGTGRKRL